MPDGLLLFINVAFWSMIFLVFWVFPALLIAKLARDKKGLSLGGFLLIGLLTSWLVSLIIYQVSPSQDNSSKKTCPKCAEQVQSAAVICKHCGNKLD